MQGRTIALQAALQLSALHALILEGIVAQTDNRETQMAEWSHEYAALLQDFYAHSAAVESIQGERFDGHLILYPEQETELTEAARTIESAVVTANDYLNRRATRADASTNGARLKINWLSALNPSKPVQRSTGYRHRPKVATRRQPRSGGN